MKHEWRLGLLAMFADHDTDAPSVALEDKWYPKSAINKAYMSFWEQIWLTNDPFHLGGGGVHVLCVCTQTLKNNFSK